MIMNGRASLRLPWAGFLTLALLAAATLPAWATGNGDNQSQTDQKKVVVLKDQEKPKPEIKIEAKPVLRLHNDLQLKHQKVEPKAVHIQVEPRDAHGLTFSPNQKVVTVTPKPKPALQIHTLTTKDGQKFTFFNKPATLTEEGQKLLTDFAADSEAIQKEADAKVAARREAAIKALEALQEQYTKAGKLDEAVAIRDYLRSGGPGGNAPFRWIKR